MSRKRILIVDDDAVVVKALTFKLEAKGYEVLGANDVSAALRLVRSENPDLLIVDINLPADAAWATTMAWDGFTLLRWLERLHEDWQKPVVIITADDPAKHQERLRQAGVVACFQKPVNTEELLAVLRQVLGESRPSSASPQSSQVG